MLGLALGALGAAVLLDLLPDPAAGVFGTLVGGLVLVTAVPEPVARTRIRRSDLRPRLGVPLRVRPLLAAGVPAIVAGWATNGLFLALGAGLVRSELGGISHTHAGIVVAVLALSGVLASRLLQRRSARTISLFATSALAVGTTLSLAALALHAYLAYVAAIAIVGAGFGTAFLGVLRTLMPATAPAERAEVMAVVYTVAYLAFGAPTILAGLLVPALGLSGTMSALGGLVVVLAVVATVLRARIREPRPISSPSAGPTARGNTP